MKSLISLKAHPRTFRASSRGGPSWSSLEGRTHVVVWYDFTVSGSREFIALLKLKQIRAGRSAEPSAVNKGEAGLRAEPAASGALANSHATTNCGGLERSDRNEWRALRDSNSRPSDS